MLQIAYHQIFPLSDGQRSNPISLPDHNMQIWISILFFQLYEHTYGQYWYLKCWKSRLTVKDKRKCVFDPVLAA